MLKQTRFVLVYFLRLYSCACCTKSFLRYCLMRPNLRVSLSWVWSLLCISSPQRSRFCFRDRWSACHVARARQRSAPRPIDKALTRSPRFYRLAGLSSVRLFSGLEFRTPSLHVSRHIRPGTRSCVSNQTPTRAWLEPVELRRGPGARSSGPMPQARV